MPKYKEFYFRAPSVSQFLNDVLTVAQNSGLDPRTNVPAEIIEDDSGSLKPGFGIDAIPAGEWWLTEPTTNSDGTIQTEGTVGTYALINVLTKEPALEQLAESFAASDPTKDPVDIPDSEKIGSGTHRIDGSQIDSPARTW